MLIQSRQPIRVGEQITIEALDGPVSGVVHELNGRSVVLITSDGRTVHVPNSTLLSEPLINDSRHGARRSEVVVRAQHTEEFDLGSLTELVARAAQDSPGVHAREHPNITVSSASSTRSTVEVQFWHHPLHTREVRSAVVQRIAETLSAAGVLHTVTSDHPAPPLVTPDEV